MWRCGTRATDTGAALPLVIALLGLLAALAVGGAYAARRHLGDVRDREAPLVAVPEAERAAIAALTVLATLDAATFDSIPVGVTGPPASSEGILTVTRTWTTRLSTSSFWIVSESVPLSKSLPSIRLGLSIRLATDRSGPVLERAWYHLP